MRRFVKIRLYKKPKKTRSFRSRVFRFASFAIILAILLSSFNLLFDKRQPKANAQTFTTSGSWTVPAGVNAAIIETWGGGGGGGGCGTNGEGGGGGGGGGYAKKTLAVNVGDIYTVTVATTAAGGSGNAGGTAGNLSKVTDPSSVVVAQANGGLGGAFCGSGNSCCTGGAGVTGDVLYTGGSGQGQNSLSAVAGGGGGGAGSNGSGGSSTSTTGGTGTSLNGGNGGAAGSNATGGAGSNYGGGGGGASKSSGSSKTGGNGAQGLVVITGFTATPPKVRQEINIIDNTLATSSTSGGIVQLDTTRYSGTVSYYFEVVTANSSASTDTVTLTRNGTSTNDSSVSLAGTGANVRVRSTAFSPPSNTQTEYVVKTGASHSIKAARIIVTQASTPLTSTETQIEIGNEETGLTNTTSAPLSSPKYWHYTAANWSTTPSFFVDVTSAQSATSANVTIILQEDDGAFGTWGLNQAFIISNYSLGTAAGRHRVPFVPHDGRNYRIVAYEGGGTRNYSIYNAKIIVDQGPWSQTGSSYSVLTNGAPAAIASLSSTRIAFIDSSNASLRAADFDGSAWSTVGSTLSITGASPELTALSSSRVAFYDATNHQLRAYDFNGSTWSLTGSGLTITSGGQAGLATMTSSRIAFYDNGNNQLRAYDFNGSTWSLTGSGLTLAGGYHSIADMSSSRVALQNGGGSTFAAYDFNGSTWSQVGSNGSASGGNPLYFGISSTRIGIIQNDLVDNFIGRAFLLDIYDFNGSTWSKSSTSVLGTAFLEGDSVTAISASRIVYTLHKTANSLADVSMYDLNTSITNLEPQYMLQNTVASSTGLQGYPTLWKTSDWATSSASFTHVIDSTSTSSSAKLQDIDNSNADITGSTATGNNQVFSSAITMPATGHQIDSNITASATTVTADRIDAAITLDGSGITPSNSAPSSPTLTAPSSGATSVSTTPTFSFSDTDQDSDDIQFTINLFQSNCTTSVTTYPMSSGQTGWSPTFDGTAGSGLTYTSPTAGSGVSFVPSSALSNSTTYCWSVSALDPGGSNTTTTSSTQSFTTAAAGPTTDQEMRGGTYFSGGTKQPIYWAQ